MLKYDRLLKRLSEYGYSASKIKETGIIGQATYYGIKNGTKNLDGKTIDKLCSILECQPSDIIEYVSDSESFSKEQIGEMLSDLRKNKGLTQTTVAFNLGITYQVYLRYENGFEMTPIEVLSKASSLYGVSLSYFGINMNADLAAVGNKGYTIKNSKTSETLEVTTEEFEMLKGVLAAYRNK